MNNSLSQYGWSSAEKLPDHDYNLPAIINLLPKGNLHILDAGCGNGYIANQLYELCHKADAIDLSSDGIKIAKEICPGVN